MRICDRCFHQGIGSTVAIKQITTNEDQVIDLCSMCFENFSAWLTGQAKAAVYEPQEVISVSERRRGRPPTHASKG